MLVVASSATRRVDAVAECPGCRQRDAEIERLSRELASLKRQARLFSHVWLGLGVVLLAVLPACALWVFFTVAEDIGDETVILPLYGMLVGVLFAAPSVLAVTSTLHWRSLWIRGLVFTLGFSLVALAYSTSFVILAEDFGIPFREAASVYPAMLLASLLPALVMRLLRRWTLAPRRIHAAPRETSLMTLIVATSLCAAAAAASRWFQIGESVSSNSGPSSVWLFVMLFASPPSALLGASLLLSLRAAMIDRLSHRCLWALAVSCLSMVSMAALAACLASLLSINNQRMDADELLHLAFVGGCAGFGAALFGLASFAWLRVAGYELLSAGKPRGTQASSEIGCVSSSRY